MQIYIKLFCLINSKIPESFNYQFPTECLEIFINNWVYYKIHLSIMKTLLINDYIKIIWL